MTESTLSNFDSVEVWESRSRTPRNYPDASETPVLKKLRTPDFGCIGDCLKKKDLFTSPRLLLLYLDRKSSSLLEPADVVEKETQSFCCSPTGQTRTSKRSMGRGKSCWSLVTGRHQIYCGL
ncbi:uncharacterized protein LOC119561789 [Drosophila subpulchrella]|uniref:uncharacterized protein LOC119561789 n=1 Tax=Drosophila subpulchrella TaxID=1486046 RepID=UPI0018A12E99|nr:uncharacterized protein LOC119561789 [Drosophila subpulchrella]